MDIQAALVKSILEKWHSYTWTVQGFGCDRTEVDLFGRQPEQYLPGDTYEQAPNEIHRSMAQDGTVTLIERPQGPPLEEADVYWPVGTEWVSAEPSTLQDHEIAPIIRYALARWDAT